MMIGRSIGYPRQQMMATFTPEQLELLDDAEEIEIETALPGGPPHRVVIWVMVEDGEVLVRSYLGAEARWFREASTTGLAVLHLEGQRIPVRVIAATDGASIDRASRGLVRKYASSPSLPPMLRPEVLDTTLRVEPA
jgi:hypothetical protein